MRVLVIEDDPSIREMLGAVLEAYNHQADLVEGGEQALERMKTSWPDVMLMDLNLAGMNGEQVYEQVQTRFGRVPPVVVMSAAPQAELRVNRIPGAWFISKPDLYIELLSNILSEAVAAKTMARTNLGYLH